MSTQTKQLKCPCLGLSTKLWESQPRGFIVVILANIYYISFWKAGSNLVSTALFTLLLGAIICCVMKLLGKKCCCCCEKKDETATTPKGPNSLVAFFKSVVSLEDPCFTLKILFILYLVSLLVGLCSDHLVIFVLMNFALLYGLINKYVPNFLFRGFMVVKQVLEGVFGIIECAIPKYEEPKEESK